MQLTTEQFIMIGQTVLFIVVLVFLTWLQYQKDQNVIGSLTRALDQLQNNPVALANAKAAGEGIPQEAFDRFYGLLAGFIGLVGKDTEVGKLATEIKQTAELIDHIPANDPVG